ncbi:MAG TPA: hypothetical protein PK095_09645 [Myxococcota bacterium]|nr:hypothetical protein [Myxococcota bacterium]
MALRFERHQTILRPDGGSEVVLSIAPQTLATQVFRHDPPTAFEVERAIDLVEDAIMETGLRLAERGELRLSEAELVAALGREPGPTRASRDEVEARFRELFSGQSRVREGELEKPTGVIHEEGAASRNAATLLIVRELLHHLGFEGVRGVR